MRLIKIVYILSSTNKYEINVMRKGEGEIMRYISGHYQTYKYE